jgi:colicin import membrane protein
MYAYAASQHASSQREKAISGLFALGVHTLFLLLLIFGVSWRQLQPPEANIVDLWSAIPSPKSITEPDKPKRVEPPLPVKEQAPPEAEVVKPDIALKEKLEKERRERLKIEAEKLQEKKLREQQRAIELEQQKKENAEEAARAQQEAAQAQLRNKYIEAIRRRVRQYIVEPPNLQGNPEAEFDVTVLPGGDVLVARLQKSSGVAAYDQAVERAIMKASPLPLPPPADPLFKSFREFTLAIRPQQ